MPYEPLHHKYRPQTFRELVGQEAIATTLSNALRQQRIAPAYLFTGARGTGKTSSARIFAKSLNCLSSDAPTPSPCGTCEVCRAIALGSALDVIEIDAASNTGVDNIRELIERAQFAPVQCRYKVYVIDECLTGDSLVLTQDGFVRLDDPSIQGKLALSYNEVSSQWEFKRVLRWLDQGDREILEIQTPHNKIKCTGNHLIRTDRGWIAARDIREGMRILSPAPAVAEPLSTSLEQMGGFGSLREVISSKATATARSLTASTVFLSKPNLYDRFANAVVGKNWTSPNFFNRKEKPLEVFNPTGSSILTKRTTESGNSELKSSLLKRVIYHLTSWVSFMERYLGMVPLVTPIPAVAFPDCFGLTDSNNKHDWNIRHAALAPSKQKSGSQRTVATEQPQCVAEPFAILNLLTCSTELDPTENERQYQSHGYPKSPLRDSLGGTWTMALSALVPKAVLKFNSTQKGIQKRKTIFLGNGLRDWATRLESEITREPVQESNASTWPWEQRLQGTGCQTCASSPSHQWTTNLERVVSVRPVGVERVYDIEVEDNHNFVANGLLVHNCHMLSAAAFNALLKTLEEPPERVVFVLATTDPQRVLATIISRCQRFDFRRIPLEAMVAHLGAIAQKESIPITDDAIQLVAQLSQGGLRDAESSLDQLSLLDGEITPERVWDLVGAVPEQDLLALMGAIAQDQPEALIDRVRQLMDRGREPSIVLQNLASFYRDLLIAKTAPDRSDLVAVTAQTWKAMVEFVSAISISLLQQGQQHLRSSEAQIRNSAQPRLWLEVTLLGLLPSATVAVAPAPAASVAPPAGSPPVRMTPPPTPVASAPAAPVAPTSPPAARPAPATPAPVAATPPPAPTATPTPPPAPEPRVAPVPITLPDPTPVEVAATVLHLEQTWQQVLGLVQPNSTQILLRQQCFLLAYSAQEARIGVRAAPLLKIASSRHSNIEAAFEQYAGHRVRVTLEVAEPLQPGSIPTTTKPSTPVTSSPAPPAALPPRPSVPSHSTNTAQTAIAPPPPTTAEPAHPPAAAEPEPMHPMAPPPIASRWDEDPLVRAANNVASFFNGQVIRLDEADVLPGGKLPGEEWTDETGSLGDEGDDVPF